MMSIETIQLSIEFAIRSIEFRHPTFYFGWSLLVNILRFWMGRCSQPAILPSAGLFGRFRVLVAPTYCSRPQSHHRNHSKNKKARKVRVSLETNSEKQNRGCFENEPCLIQTRVIIMLMQYALCILSVRSMPTMFHTDESINQDFYDLLYEEENDLLNEPVAQYGQLQSNGGKLNLYRSRFVSTPQLSI